MDRKITLLSVTFCLVIFINLLFGNSNTNNVQASYPNGVGHSVYLPFVSTPPDSEWLMSGANPQRTSWTPTEIRGKLEVAWYRPIDPYIPPKVEIIAANNTLFISTARGLYALDADTGNSKWIFPTEMPLGNSPTYNNGVVYVGGFDHKLYAIDANSGKQLWNYDGAAAGYDTNPLVVGNIIYVGNRDGFMYAIYANTHPQKGQLAWKFHTAGSIHLSAAYKNNSIFFASDDSYAYALDATNGSLVWKTFLPTGNGFHSYWPVIFGNTIVFQGIKGYRYAISPNGGLNDKVFITDPELAEPWTPGANELYPRLPDGRMDVTRAVNFFKQKPWRRTYYLLDINTGKEILFDFNVDGVSDEYAPLVESNKTSSGTTHPPAVGPDGKLYLAFQYISSGINRGQVAGWEFGSKYITTPANDEFGAKSHASDEPLAYSMGGNVVYYSLCCDREIGSFGVNQKTNWKPWALYNLASLIPGYNVKYIGGDPYYVNVYGSINGVYGCHGEQDSPIPYNGKVFIQRSNAIIAFSTAGSATSLPVLGTIQVQDPVKPLDTNNLKQKLSDEISKIISAGHLRPGYGVEGYFSQAGHIEVGDNLTDYFHNPADTFWALSRAYPYLPTAQQIQLKAYLANEYANYNPLDYTHIGWANGVSRDASVMPPEIDSDRTNSVDNPFTSPSMWSSMSFQGWTGPDWRWTPYTFYALWKYAQINDNPQAIAREILNKNSLSSYHRLTSPPDDATLIAFPFAHNSWVAGYRGYMELEKLAGNISDISQSTRYSEYQRLLNLRATSFSKDNPWGGPHPNSVNFGQSLAVARNFMFLTPELAQYLHDNALSKVQSATNEYETVAPYWFVSKFEATYLEGGMQPLYDYNALFQAKALILKESPGQLVKFLDVPAFARGDLFYIQNLVTVIEASSN
jgi:outer membrane protein assembly factor BamB